MLINLFTLTLVTNYFSYFLEILVVFLIRYISSRVLNYEQQFTSYAEANYVEKLFGFWRFKKLHSISWIMAAVCLYTLGAFSTFVSPLIQMTIENSDIFSRGTESRHLLDRYDAASSMINASLAPDIHTMNTKVLYKLQIDNMTNTLPRLSDDVEALWLNTTAPVSGEYSIALDIFTTVHKMTGYALQDVFYSPRARPHVILSVKSQTSSVFTKTIVKGTALIGSGIDSYGAYMIPYGLADQHSTHCVVNLVLNYNGSLDDIPGERVSCSQEQLNLHHVSTYNDASLGIARITTVCSSAGYVGTEVIHDNGLTLNVLTKVVCRVSKNDYTKFGKTSKSSLPNGIDNNVYGIIDVNSNYEPIGSGMYTQLLYTINGGVVSIGENLTNSFDFSQFSSLVEISYEANSDGVLLKTITLSKDSLYVIEPWKMAVLIGIPTVVLLVLIFSEITGFMPRPLWSLQAMLSLYYDGNNCQASIRPKYLTSFMHSEDLGHDTISTGGHPLLAVRDERFS